MSTDNAVEGKAKELVDRFLQHTKQFDARLGWMDDKEAAKQCALIAVDEILTLLEDIDKNNISLDFTDMLNFWDYVKDKIKSM